MGTVTLPITDKQVSFLRNLLDTREVIPALEAQLRKALDEGTLDRRTASARIGDLMNAPRKVVARPESPWAAVDAAVADLETSFYAIPAGYVHAQPIDLHGNDYLFVRVRNMGRKRRIHRVHGSVGTPRYTALNPVSAVAVANLIRGRHVEFAANWHAVSGNCGRCNALLTDAESRERGLGPDCAKLFKI